MLYKKNLEIQEMIKQERERQGISIRKFAKMIGCTHRSVVYWNKGERVMTIEMADRALKSLGISVVLGKDESLT